LSSLPPAAEPARVPVLLRRAALSDLDALVDLERRSFESDRLSRRSYFRLLERASARVTVAEVHCRAAGGSVLLFNDATSVARLYSLSVDPRYRGRGIARSLLAAALQTAAARKRALLRLEVRVDNTPARRLYESAGFEPIERIARYYADGMDAVRMQRALEPPERAHLCLHCTSSSTNAKTSAGRTPASGS
jgi:ribosomal protein S18 acetylase RimI-like enzyme